MKNRAYSILKIKSVDNEKRVISGMATTPGADRVGDIIEPLGVQYKNPSPLLWMHQHDLPVGTVNFGKPTKDGVPFTASIPQIDQPTGLKARIDEAWESVKAGLVAAVSIGFRALEWSVIEETGGIRFLKTELLELSLVTVPANAEATINSIKSLDQEYRKAALGKKSVVSIKGKPSGVPGKLTIKPTPKEGNTMSIADKIKQFRDEIAVKTARRLELANKSAEENVTFDEAEQEEFDTLTSEITDIEKHVSRLEVAAKSDQATARPVTEKTGLSSDAAAQARNGGHIRVTPQIEKGVAFARLARCRALSRIDQMPAHEIASALYPDDQRIANILKAVVSGGTTTGTTWAAPLIGAEGTVFSDFAEFLRPQTIIGKFGTNGIPALRRVPFRTRLISQTSGGAGYWVGEGGGKPVTKFDFAGTSLLPLKAANIAVCTMELLRDSSPSAELLVRDQLAAALRERLDMDFIDINKAAVSSTSPASITHGISRVTSVGSTADDIRCDISAVMAAFIAANNAPTTGVWIMPATTALALSLMVNALGQSEFPNISMAGGTFAGLPVIVSEYVQSDSTGAFVVLVNASDIYFGDDGEVEVKMSDQASLQMLDGSASGAGAPTNNSATPTATTVVSMFQTNSVAFLAERTINWSRRRTSAVGVIDGVNWGSCPVS